MANIGSVVAGKYKIERLIGKGGMSKVYLALDTRLGKRWAVKEIEKNARDAQKNRVVANSALSEANLMKGLDNYYLPRISDILDNGKTVYVVMDYVEGESLKAILARDGAQSQDNVVKWGRQLCQALHYLHTRKPPIIYRDMKPGNVMVKPDGDIKLIDFGIAREYVKGGDADTTSLGTRGYAAPEQFDAAARSDMRTDIYNLGATLYHAATGHDPSKAPYEMKPIRSWVPSLSAGLEKVIKKCTNPDPKRRYQSVSQLLDALQKIGAGDETTLPVPEADDDETTILSEYVPPAGAVPSPVAPGGSGVLGGSGGSGALGAPASPGIRKKAMRVSGPSASSAVRRVPQQGQQPQAQPHAQTGKVKPLYIALPAAAVAAIIILVLALGAGPEPKDVAGLKGDSQGTSAIALSWDPSDKADGYEVRIAVADAAVYGNTGKTPPPQPLDVKEPEIVISDLICDESYICEVRAYADEENTRVYQKGESASLDVRTDAPDMSAKGLSAAAIGYDSADVKWEPVQISGGEVLYHLLVSNTADGAYIEQYAGAEQAFVSLGLAPETAYFYKVVADTTLDGKAFSGESEAVGVTTGAVQMAAPDIEADAQGYSSVKASWSKVKAAGATITYELQRSTKKADGFGAVYNGKKRSRTDTGLDASTRYYYKVVAIASIAGREYRTESKVVSAQTSARPVQSSGGTSQPTGPVPGPVNAPPPARPDPGFKNDKPNPDF